MIATPRVRSTPSGTRSSITPPSASEFVLVRWPSRADSPGSAPVSRRRCSSCCVPHAPAAKTTWSAVTALAPLRTHAPVASVVTTYAGRPVAARTSTTVRSGSMVAPARSASAR